jgi:3-hydroxyisobutyrate dehydrogenase-like beta-hydroxyacid dehydrogenase
MGSAFARATAAASHSVTVWNRSADKANALESERIHPLASLQDAVDASPTVLVIVSTYDDALEALSNVVGWEGKTLINAGSSNPSDVTRFASWAGSVGARYLDAAIFAYPQDIGTPSASVLFSGAAEAWDRSKDILAALGGRVAYLSDNPVEAAVLDIAAVGCFYTCATSAFLEALAFGKAWQIPPANVLAVAEPLVEILRHTMRDATEAVASDQYESDQVTVATYAEAMRRFLGALRDAGQHAGQVGAVVDSFDAAEAAGYADRGFYSLVNVTART